MTLDEIKELLKLFNESGVGELELQRGENRLRLRRVDPAPVIPQAPVVFAGPAPAPASVPPSAAATAPVPQAAAPAKSPEPAAEQILVKSPIVGTFYEASSPDAPPFVKVGDSVEPGQVLCIIESMKLMNEIESEVAGTIVAKLVENGRPVEYGEALYAIQPR
jgi:acetyl-CoA carboxylase biotin carboxyl carrier protein